MENLQGRRILITGAAGFIGANLCRALLEQGANVHAFLHPETKLWRIQEILGRLSVHMLDLVDGSAVQRAVEEIRPQHIIHLAVRRAEAAREERLRTLQANVTGLYNLLEAAEGQDYLSFLYTGSSLEYGPGRAAHKETDRPNPALFYAATRAASTLICQQFARARQRPIIILRLFSVYGYWEAPGRLIPVAILKSLAGEELALTVPGFRRDLVFVEDVLDAYLLALGGARKTWGKIINIGSGREWSNEAVVEQVQEATGRALTIRPGAYPMRPADTAHWVADIRRAERLLGWQPRNSLRSGLEKTVAWFRSQPPEVAAEYMKKAP